MNIRNIFKKTAVALTGVIVASVMVGGAVASAIPYTGADTPPSPVPAFNVYSGNNIPGAPAGGESNFYRGRVPVDGNLNESTTKYGDPVNATCTKGQIIQMNVYVHNGASQYKNNNGDGPSVAHNTKVKVSLPSGEASSFSSTATISASNAASVSDGLTITCANGKKVKLQYVTGSASQWSEKTGVVALSDSIVTTGASIRSDKKAGDVWGCWTDRVYVILAAKVVEVEKPKVVEAMCKIFEVTATNDRKVTVSNFQSSTTNATFTKVVINWGDGSSDTVNDVNKVEGTTHQYTKDGEFKITTTVTYTSTVNDQVINSTEESCSTKVTFSSEKPPVVTPPTTPSELPKTGAGSLVGIFAAVSAASAVAYRWFIGRRLSA